MCPCNSGVGPRVLPSVFAKGKEAMETLAP